MDAVHASILSNLWPNSLRTKGGIGIALYYDDPEATPLNELCSDAGVFVDDDFTTTDSRVHIVDTAGGAYAVATHIGAYEGLPNVWGELVGKWLPASGYAFGDSPGFEVYLNDCSKVPIEQVRTEICVPIKRP